MVLAGLGRLPSDRVRSILVVLYTCSHVGYASDGDEETLAAPVDGLFVGVKGQYGEVCWLAYCHLGQALTLQSKVIQLTIDEPLGLGSSRGFCGCHCCKSSSLLLISKLERCCLATLPALAMWHLGRASLCGRVQHCALLPSTRCRDATPRRASKGSAE